MALSGCSDSSVNTPAQCKEAVKVGDILLKAAADGMTAYPDLIEAYDARDLEAGRKALARIDASNATVDRYRVAYETNRAACLGSGGSSI